MQEKETIIERLNNTNNNNTNGMLIIERKELKSEKNKTNLVDREQSDLYLLSQKQYPVRDELAIVKENYKDLEKQYVLETESYRGEIK